MEIVNAIEASEIHKNALSVCVYFCKQSKPPISEQMLKQEHLKREEVVG